MRKLAMMLAAVAALLALGAGSVLAQEGDAGSEVEGAKVVTDKAGNQTIQCTGVPCTASGRSDLVFERQGVGKKDRILLKGGDDQVRANTYGADRDVIKGHDGFDLIYVNDEDTLDRIYGGKGNDKCYVDARKEVVSGCSRIIVSSR
jgi:Ca2+-binding RTX toxin-like protein